MNEHSEGSNMGRSAWQSQPLSAPPLSLAFIHCQIQKLDAERKEHTTWAYVAIAVCVIAALFGLLNPPPVASPMGYVIHIGMSFGVLGALHVGWQIRRLRSQLAARADDSVLQSLDAYRAELQRLRDYYLESWRGVWPLLPAVLVLIVGGSLYDDRPLAWLRYVLASIFAVVFTLLGVWHYRRKGHDLQRELDALDTLKRG